MPFIIFNHEADPAVHHEPGRGPSQMAPPYSSRTKLVACDAQRRLGGVPEPADRASALSNSLPQSPDRFPNLLFRRSNPRTPSKDVILRSRGLGELQFRDFRSCCAILASDPCLRRSTAAKCLLPLPSSITGAEPMGQGPRMEAGAFRREDNVPAEGSHLCLRAQG